MTQLKITSASSLFATKSVAKHLALVFLGGILSGLTLFAQGPTSFGAQAGDIRVNGDFDADGLVDEAFWRPTTGVWYVDPTSSPGAPTSVPWGNPGDVPVAGNYDNPAQTDYAVWRPSNGTWYVLSTTSGTQLPAVQWGAAGDIPVPGDYDGDGLTDYAVWRPSNGTWYVIPSSNPSMPITFQWGSPGDIPVPGDYNGDGQIDYAVYRPSEGNWYVTLSGTAGAPNTSSPIVQQWGAPGDVPIGAFDFDGDSIADFVIWRSSDQLLYIIPSSSPTTFYTLQCSSPTSLVAFAPLLQVSNLGITDAVWVRVDGDYDGDGIQDFALWSLTAGNTGEPANAGIWYIVLSSAPGQPITQPWGLPGDVPVSGDYDGDGKTDLAIWRPADGTWYIIPSSNPGSPFGQPWGASGDIPVTGHYSGSTSSTTGLPLADYAIWRPADGTWYVLPNNSTTPITWQWGASGDIPVPGDYDGDGKSDFAVWRSGTGTWYVTPSSNPNAPITVQWGAFGDVPVTGDFLGDGVASYDIWRPSAASYWMSLDGTAAGYQESALPINPIVFQLSPPAH
ncbi:MAG: VCBS repeat-containing protein [Acidobacteriaceae bacterium]|nr:VCBS repeat-containing protein [Acidobacteriaceae bacterium]MBV9781003.1 VCBS repeat-containing protein [Acidobacteriaceae bacterium]